MTRCVLLLSGGLDSTTLLYWLRHEGYGVLPMVIRYGQRHVREVEAALAVAPTARVLDMPRVQRVAPEIPDGHYNDASMKVMVYPNRNMIFLALAVGVAVDTGAEAVAYAAHAGDHTIYPDCRPEFVEAMRRAIATGNWNAPALMAPFVGRNKADIVRIGAELGVPFGLTWSCYRGGDEHCGSCGTCVERREAFVDAGVADPTTYANVLPRHA